MIFQCKTHLSWKCFFFIFLLLLMSDITVHADYQTDLQPGEAIQDVFGSDLDAGAWSIPVVYDWNNDGKKDLIVGVKISGGKGVVAYFKNIGENDSPAFDGSYSEIQACDNTCRLEVVGTGG